MHIGLIGASGRLGTLTNELLTQQCIPFTQISRENLLNINNFIELLRKIPEDLVILDLSLPTGTTNLCNIINELNLDILKKIRGVVVGTTGHDERQKDLLLQTSKQLPVCIVSNFSKGVYLFEELLQAKTSKGMSVAELAKALGFDLAISEIHHTKKKDAPSGTALTLAEFAHISKNHISSVRVGKVVGEHILYLSSDSESLEITHTAHTRKLFAEGAIELCKNIFNHSPKPGFIKKEDFFIP
jgi:4-hydroxy-tetrahydrodipicolinate reductase